MDTPISIMKATVIESIGKLEHMVRHADSSGVFAVYVTSNLVSSEDIILTVSLIHKSMNYRNPLPAKYKYQLTCKTYDPAENVVREIIQYVRIQEVVHTNVDKVLKTLQDEIEDIRSKHYREQGRLDSLIGTLKKIPFIKNYILKKKVFDL